LGASEGGEDDDGAMLDADMELWKYKMSNCEDRRLAVLELENVRTYDCRYRYVHILAVPILAVRNCTKLQSLNCIMPELTGTLTFS
jgi:hypothetical protein